MADNKSRVRFTAGRVADFTCPAGKSQAFLWDVETPCLILRATPGGRKTYAFEGRLDGTTIRVNIGTPAEWTLDAARQAAAKYKTMADEGRDPREVLRERTEADKARRLEREHATTHTLEHLLIAYCDYLQSIGRRSHSDARSIFNLHVIGAWPKIASKPANKVTGENIADMMRRLIEQGHGRTANKLRSYVKAAYAMAKSARSKPSLPVALKAYDIRENPGDDTAPDTAANRADKNPLSIPELRMYWSIIKDIEGIKGDVLRLHLLTGGQRIEQLVRLQPGDISTGYITLHDGKGRPGKEPRPFTVPLLPPAAQALRQCASTGAWALSSDGGVTHINGTTLSDWAKVAVGDAIADFSIKRIRSGVETALASVRVSMEVRGHLQSHGIAGVQRRHYDAHDYLEEKTQALEALWNLITQEETTNVIPIRAA